MRICVLLIVAFLWTFGAFADEIPGTQFSHGAWRGAGYVSASSGRFTHCAIAAEYVTGDTLFMSVNSDATISIAVANSAFQFKEGETFPLTLTVDRRKSFAGRAVAEDTDMFVIHLGDFEELFTALKRGNRLYVTGDTVQGRYSLRGTSRALDKTLNCASENLQHASKPPSVASQYDRSLLYQIATGMIAETGVTDFVFLSEKEVDGLGAENAVVWKSSSAGLIGSVFLSSTVEGQALRDNDSIDIEELTRQCSGDVISGTRAIESAELPTRELRVICAEKDVSIETIASKTMLDGVILYTTLAFIDTERREAMEGQNRREISDDIRLRAASFILPDAQ
ncbi:hypothetical protein [Hoeflea poritis]|uniref:Uncharacterized protein n=1 Tax=Hoeflea poritis TaxID=2993659 RepID=A0ABT4VHS7_9HYPH|nr:hypothetical protein [Hoeflea poritis]MDA4844149.1 hypothetical protein [Hoeflea poritis]